METDFETHDPVVGSYPRRCDEDYYNALRETYAVLDRHAPRAVQDCVTERLCAAQSPHVVLVRLN